MCLYREPRYRTRVHPRGLISFRVSIKETDLLVSAPRDLSTVATDRVHTYRRQLENYIILHPDFLSTLLPYPEDALAPDIISDMISVSGAFGVGPMASVAGTIAQFVGNDLLEYAEEVIVENGGDIFLKANRPVTVSVFAGRSKLSNKLGLVLYPHQMPAGICTSSGTVGHSLSFGIADAVCILAQSASIADAAATAIGNMITDRWKLKATTELIREWRDIKGGVVIIGETMATWGEVELTTVH